MSDPSEPRHWRPSDPDTTTPDSDPSTDLRPYDHPPAGTVSHVADNSPSEFDQPAARELTI